MFIIGAVPDSLLSMKKKPKQKGYKLTGADCGDKVNSPNRATKSFWSKATGGRMK